MDILHKMKTTIIVLVVFYFLILSFVGKNFANTQEVITKYAIPNTVDINLYNKIPKILSQEDVKLYHKIFQLEAQNNYKDADKIILKLGNKLLLGYVYYARYTNAHYQATFIELNNWLKEYGDLGAARNIYLLARNIASNKEKKKINIPTVINWGPLVPIYNRYSKLKESNALIENNIFTVTAPEISNNYAKSIDKYLRKGKTKIVKNLLEDKKAKKLLNPKAYDYYSTRLATSYFMDGRDDFAQQWAKKALVRSYDSAADAWIVLGLSYWRQHQYQQAADSFGFVVANKEKFPIYNIARAGYWAARANLVLGKYDAYYYNLAVTSTYTYGFYGLLASEELGVTINLNNSVFEPSGNYLDSLIDTRHGIIGLALLQVGLVEYSQKEFLMMMQYELDSLENTEAVNSLIEGLIYIVDNTNMPMLSYRMSGVRGSYYGLIDYSYPVVNSEPNNGYELDPTLVLAVIRRESNFDTYAESWVGAKGLMQLMPTTAAMVMKRYGYDDTNLKRLNVPKYNMDLGQKYLQMLIDNPAAGGNLIYVLGGWNGGFSNVRNWKRQSHRQVEDPLFFIESIPFRETKNFVANVIADYWIYQIKFDLEPKTLKNLVRNQNPIYEADSASVAEIKKVIYGY